MNKCKNRGFIDIIFNYFMILFDLEFMIWFFKVIGLVWLIYKKKVVNYFKFV